MFAFLQGQELLIVLAIVLLVFGAAKLPKLARSMGEAQREFKKGLAAEHESDEPAKSDRPT